MRPTSWVSPGPQTRCGRSTIVGTTLCPEVTIPDPDPSAPDASPDGLVHGLRNCAVGQDVVVQDPDALFVLEDFSAYAAFAPLIQAFANHNREDLYLALLETVYRHWADKNDAVTDCNPAGNVTTDPQYCTQDGMVTYEPLFIQAFPGDIFPALGAATVDADTTTIAHETRLRQSSARGSIGPRPAAASTPRR